MHDSFPYVYSLVGEEALVNFQELRVETISSTFVGFLAKQCHLQIIF